ncbi:phospholipase A [Thalassolituus sp. LLYu03]|uniref:phospholipase A n=1 Tax=Thalassolituus sp. LLYu03 TaxID=3421656 RepID=UPI003D28AD8F
MPKFRISPLIISCLLLCGLHQTALADDDGSSADPETEASGELNLDLSDLLPAKGELKTEKKELETIADEEFTESMKQLPGLVERLRIEQLASDSPYVLLPHRPNYVLPLTWQARPSDKELDRVLQHYTGDPDAGREAGNDHFEAVFQISIKYPVSTGLFGKFSKVEVAYTNRSFWQAYNGDISRPFRETNHEPELIVSWAPENRWVDYFALALNHQSNGQTSSMSRSWNRVIVQTASLVPTGVVSVRAWWRIPETSKADPWDPQDNDNPDIDDYMGPGEINYMHVIGNQTLSLMVRNNLNPDENRGAVELGWSFPLNRKIKGYVQYFNGYGESLIDYNRYQERIGVGIKLSDWF